MDGRRCSSLARPRTLLIPCESARGFAAGGFAGNMAFALEEAIAARSVSCTVVPSFEEIASHSPHAWPYHAPRMLGDVRFDQAWVWLGRTPFDESFLEWLAAAAPLRIGVVLHPLDYPVETYRRAPHLLAHRAAIEQQLRHFTHVLVHDEVDAPSIGERLGLPALWVPSWLPSRIGGQGAQGAQAISQAPTVASQPRRAMLVDEAAEAAPASPSSSAASPSPSPAPSIAREIARLDFTPHIGPLAGEFAALQREQVVSLAAGAATAEAFDRYVASRNSIRVGLAERRAQALARQGIHSIGVTLAPDANTCPAVALECMAARVPVVCRDIPYRPRNRALFLPGRHIRLFGIGDRGSLAGHLRELTQDAALADAQADAAFALVQRDHTAERRVDQIFEWLSTGRMPDMVGVDDEVRAPRGPAAADTWYLPASYQRRTSSQGTGRVHALTHVGVRAHDAGGGPGAERDGESEGEGPADVHRLAVALAHAAGCTRLVDIGCPDPPGLVRVAHDIDAVGICAPDILQSYQRRCADVAWRDIDADASSLLAELDSGEATMILCARQFERSRAPHLLAAALSRFVARARCGLVVSVDREYARGPGDAGPPPTPAHLQEWTRDELIGLLRDAGLLVLHQAVMPAGLGRREPAHMTLVVVHEAAAVVSDSRTAFPGALQGQRSDHPLLARPGASATTSEDVRDQVSTAVATACEAYARERASLSDYERIEMIANPPPAFVMSTVPNAPETPALQALMGDDRWVAMHSGRAPIDEARRWADSIRCEGDGPIVLFGLGLGYHALALAAAAAPSRRLIVVEPFPDVVTRAREVQTTRDALDSGRLELVEDWPAFKALVEARPLPLASICPVSIPVYERIAEEAHAWFSTQLHAAIAWARAGLESTCKPFLHPEGMSVVITTFNRVERAAALVDGIARQQPPGVPVEILLINDHGSTDVFAAARDVARRTGCDLRTFDTYYAGYGPALARNVGLRFARYDTTVFLDDDVEVGPDLLRCYRDAPSGVRIGRIDFLNSQGFRRAQEDRLRQVPDRRLALRGPARVLRPWTAYEGFMWSANCAVPTEVGLALGGFDEAFLNEGEEDLDFSARAVRATRRPIAVPSALALHHELDRSGEAASVDGRKARVSRANERLADPARGVIVNGGAAYWAGDRWHRYIVT